MFKNKNTVVIFSYNIGCVGAIGPVDIKYFSFYNSREYILRGQEFFILDNGVDEEYKRPIPDYNLPHNKVMLEYIQNKWSLIAIKIIF